MSNTYSYEGDVLIYKNGICQAKQFIEDGIVGFKPDNTVHATRFIEDSDYIAIGVGNNADYEFKMIAELDMQNIPKLYPGNEFNEEVGALDIFDYKGTDDKRIKKIIFNTTLKVPSDNKLRYKSTGLGDHVIGYALKTEPNTLFITVTPGSPKIIIADESCEYMFANLQYLEEIDLGNLLTYKTTNFSSMCQNCIMLKKINIEQIDLSNGELFHSMFQNCHSLRKLDLSKTKNRKAKYMDSMFASSGIEELDLSGFTNENLICINSMCIYMINLKSIGTGLIQYYESLVEACDVFTLCNLTERASIYFNGTGTGDIYNYNMFLDASGFDLYSTEENYDFVEEMATIYDTDDQSKIVHIGSVTHFTDESNNVFTSKEQEYFIV